jgi:hypothetical protein
MPQCRITQQGNELLLSFPYNPAMVAALKSSIPSTDRKFDPDTKMWRVSPSKAAKIQNLCHVHFGELPLVPTIATVKPVIKQQVLDVRYVGTTKDRGNDDRSAYGWTGDGWNAVFTETVLRMWFEGITSSPTSAPTLYSVLGLQRDADESAIKTGYRRMVMQWHPDKCREPNAQEQFMAIQHAYEVLSKNRESYDVGLMLEASLRAVPSENKYVDALSSGYRSPLRCGLILCEGVETLGVFNVSKIFAWEDIQDVHGRTLVVSWPAGAKQFIEDWT